jgi:hypothetical protein
VVMYRYACRCGKDLAKDFPSGQAAKTVRCQCGKRADRHFGRGTPARGDVWNDHWSDSAGVHPSQIPEVTAMLYERTGKRYDFDGEGRIHFESRGHRAAALKAMGMRDMDAGYSDPN